MTRHTKNDNQPYVISNRENGQIPSIGKPAGDQIRSQSEISTRMEYVLVTFHDYRGWRPRYINGHELSDWMNNPLIHEYIEKMVDDGWEIAAASAGVRLYGSADNHQIYFRRPRDK